MESRKTENDRGPIDFLVIKENIKKLLHVYHIHKTFTFLGKKSCINCITVVSNIGFEMLIKTLKKRFFYYFTHSSLLNQHRK